MTCSQCRSMADSYLAGELPVDTSHDLIAHLDACPACRAEVEARRALRDRMRLAFARNPALAPDAAFLADLRARLRRDHARRRGRARPPAWLALAAALVLIASTSALWVWRSHTGGPDVAWARLAAHAAGDHRYCALQHALEEPPISLEEAARRYDPMYAQLREVVAATAPVRSGRIEILAAHACVYDRRRFGHLVARRDGRVLSVLVTPAATRRTGGVAGPVEACGAAGGFEVACATAGDYLVFLVSDQSADDNQAIALTLLLPLQAYLARQ